jgi:hypothetical protein
MSVIAIEIEFQGHVNRPSELLSVLLRLRFTWLLHTGEVALSRVD